jgi:hypothetical protein
MIDKSSTSTALGAGEPINATDDRQRPGRSGEARLRRLQDRGVIPSYDYPGGSQSGRRASLRAIFGKAQASKRGCSFVARPSLKPRALPNDATMTHEVR